MDSWGRGREVEKPKRLPVDRDIVVELDDIVQEVMRARAAHAKWNSAHEGYAVILEELDELWAEVKKKRTLREPAALRTEARQVAAMAIRFLVDIVPRETGTKR